MESEILLKPGASHTIVLKSRGSAGYSWVCEVAGDTHAVEALVTGVESPPAAGAGRPPAGSAGEQLLIKAVAPGEATLHLSLRRAWEKDKAPLEEHYVKVVVRD